MSIYTLPDNFDIRGGRGRGSSRDREAEGRGVEGRRGTERPKGEGSRGCLAVGGLGLWIAEQSGVKVLKNSMTSSFARSNRGILVQSYAKIFWNGVPDRIIRLLLRIILSGTPLQNNFGELRTIMLLLLSPNDEVLVLLNPLTLDKM